MPHILQLAPCDLRRKRVVIGLDAVTGLAALLIQIQAQLLRTDDLIRGDDQTLLGEEDRGAFRVKLAELLAELTKERAGIDRLEQKLAEHHRSDQAAVLAVVKSFDMSDELAGLFASALGCPEMNCRGRAGRFAADEAHPDLLGPWLLAPQDGHGFLDGDSCQLTRILADCRERRIHVPRHLHVVKAGDKDVLADPDAAVL